MAPDKITRVSVTHIPVAYRKEVGKNAYIDNIGLTRSEWLGRVGTDSGLEGSLSSMRPDAASEALHGAWRKLTRRRGVWISN